MNFTMRESSTYPVSALVGFARNQLRVSPPPAAGREVVKKALVSRPKKPMESTERGLKQSFGARLLIRSLTLFTCVAVCATIALPGQDRPKAVPAAEHSAVGRWQMSVGDMDANLVLTAEDGARLVGYIEWKLPDNPIFAAPCSGWIGDGNQIWIRNFEVQIPIRDGAAKTAGRQFEAMVFRATIDSARRVMSTGQWQTLDGALQQGTWSARWKSSLGSTLRPGAVALAADEWSRLARTLSDGYLTRNTLFKRFPDVKEVAALSESADESIRALAKLRNGWIEDYQSAVIERHAATLFARETAPAYGWKVLFDMLTSDPEQGPQDVIGRSTGQMSLPQQMAQFRVSEYQALSRASFHSEQIRELLVASMDARAKATRPTGDALELFQITCRIEADGSAFARLHNRTKQDLSNALVVVRLKNDEAAIQKARQSFAQYEREYWLHEELGLRRMAGVDKATIQEMRNERAAAVEYELRPKGYVVFCDSWKDGAYIDIGMPSAPELLVLEPSVSVRIGAGEFQFEQELALATMQRQAKEIFQRLMNPEPRQR